eukprot:6292664-Pyramimonas_sp.AAC.1
MVTHIRLPRWRPTQGDAIWTIRVFPNNLTARLRDRRREGSAVLPARTTRTCILHRMIGIRDIADGMTRMTIIGCVRVVRRATGRTNLDMH